MLRAVSAIVFSARVLNITQRCSNINTIYIYNTISYNSRPYVAGGCVRYLCNYCCYYNGNVGEKKSHPKFAKFQFVGYFSIITIIINCFLINYNSYNTVTINCKIIKL